MNTLELQQTLAEEIALIHDTEFLEALKSIIDMRLSADVYQLSDYQPDIRVRTGWAKAAKEMHQCGDDQLLIDDVFDDEIIK